MSLQVHFVYIMYKFPTICSKMLILSNSFLFFIILFLPLFLKNLRVRKAVITQQLNNNYYLYELIN